MNILAIDDNIGILEGLGEICKIKSWRPFMAQDVKSGIEVLKENDIDLILIDYHMPIISGLVGVKMIRELNASIPIIVLTVDENQAIADAFLDAGASDFALKPIKVPDLISRIGVHLKYSKKTDDSIERVKLSIKGINHSTLEIIIKYMKSRGGEMTINDIAKGTGYAYQTVHRYLNSLIEIDYVKITHTTGRRGRPTLLYKCLD